MDSYATTSAFFIFTAPALWNTLGHLEYNSRKISNFFGSKRNGFIFVMIAIIVLQILRNVTYYMSCIYSQPMFPAIDEMLNNYDGIINIIAIPIQIIGWVLSLSSFYRLGFKGTYEGDCFGYLFDEMITSFPFGTVPHPMYFGGALLFISSALYYHSSTALVLSLWSIFNYVIFSYLVEQPYTEMIYSDREKKKSNDAKRGMIL
ncbi:Phosphatidylethanolamine N-methyltransferase [Entamoeba marina]